MDLGLNTDVRKDMDPVTVESVRNELAEARASLERLRMVAQEHGSRNLRHLNGSLMHLSDVLENLNRFENAENFERQAIARTERQGEPVDMDLVLPPIDRITGKNP